MDKIKSFLKYLEENNIKKAVLLNRENINYFLERYPPTYSLLTFEVETSRAVLNVPKLEYRASQIYRNKNIEVSMVEKVENLIKGGDAFEDTLPLKYVKYIPKDYKIISPKIMEMKSIKTDKEIEFIKMASKISKKSLEYGIDYLLNSKEEIKEIELAAEIEYSMKKKGSIKPAFDTIVISNKKTALPHGMPSKDIIKNIVLIDIGAVYEGYCSDITRTILLREDKKYREIYELVNSVKNEVEDHIKEGTVIRELDNMAKELMGDYKKYFIHSLGHGVGVNVHEEPSISSKIEENLILKKNMIITIEPGIYLNDFGVRIEDLYLVKKNGFKNLSS
ncbi:MAG TPA: M24 family metallopeptidase [Methanothermococcus okinawensis]|uniref:M24 family metallopeptidase n=1 Tax=Methanothermococcus okinawensis TaxID=155863 RepID=A0A833DRD8_9EURY|nr:M24 family metallopeptidase [Methanothermococcus okinawensis]